MTDHSARSDPESAAMLARIGDAFDADLPPLADDLTAIAKAAFGWRLVDAQLADLLFDSADAELIGVRGTSTERRSFRYAAGETVVRVHLTPNSLIVMVEPPQATAVRIVSDQAVDDHVTDEFGELAVEAPALPVRLELELASGRYVTPWITG